MVMKFSKKLLTIDTKFFSVLHFHVPCFPGHISSAGQDDEWWREIHLFLDADHLRLIRKITTVLAPRNWIKYAVEAVEEISLNIPVPVNFLSSRVFDTALFEKLCTIHQHFLSLRSANSYMRDPKRSWAFIRLSYFPIHAIRIIHTYTLLHALPVPSPLNILLSLVLFFNVTKAISTNPTFQPGSVGSIYDGSSIRSIDRLPHIKSLCISSILPLQRVSRSTKSNR